MSTAAVYRRYGMAASEPRVKNLGYVFELMPGDAYAVATKEPGGATRWTF
jgi:hypothetical protein